MNSPVVELIREEMEGLLNTEKYIERIKSIRSQEDEEKILEDVMDEASIKVEKSDKLTSVVNLLAAENK